MAKRRSNAKSKQFHFEGDISYNVVEMPNQKKFSHYDLKNIKPLTDSQKKVFDTWGEDLSMELVGSAGTGKSMVALYLAMNEILTGQSEYNKLIIIRSAVPSREVGHLPGTLQEKTEIYELPYKQLFDDIFKKTNQYKYLKEAHIVDFQTTSFIRGLTFDNAIVLFDECQNATYEELSTVITRLAGTSKLILCGDTKQNDLIFRKSDVSGFQKFLNITRTMPSMRKVTFTLQDVVRGGLVKEFLQSEEWYEEQRNKGK